MAGTSIAAALPIAISPILSRLFTPESFGLFALYIQIVSLLSIVSTGRYEYAILLPKNQIEANSVRDISFLISMLVSLTSGLFIGIFRNEISVMLKIGSDYSFILYLIPIGVLLMSIIRIVEQYSIRLLYYAELSKSKVVQSLAVSVSNIGFGATQWGPLGLILSSILSMIVFIVYLHRKVPVLTSDWGTVDRWVSAAIKHKQFVIYDLPNALIYEIGVRTFGLLLFYYVNPVTVGLYYMAEKLIQKPVSIINQSLQKSLYQHQSNLKREKAAFFKDAEYISNKIALLIPIYILLLFIPSDVYTYIFGDKWGDLKIFIDSFLAIHSINILFSPFTFVYKIFNKQQIALKMRFLIDGSKIALFFYLFTMYEALTALAFWFVLISTTIGLIYVLVANWFLTKKIHLKSIAKYLIVTCSWYALSST